MGNLVEPNSSAEVLERCAHELQPQIVSVWLCFRAACASASYYVEVILMFAYFIPQNGWEIKCIIYDNEATVRFAAAKN